MPAKYMFTDTPYEERVHGLYPEIEQTLLAWAEGKVEYEEFSFFMDYIRDEMEQLDSRDNFAVGIWLWGWDAGKLFKPEDIPMFLKMLNPENLYSQSVRDEWNAYWKAMDIKQRAKDYLRLHPQTTDEELREIIRSLPVGDELPLTLYDTDQSLKLLAENNEKYFKQMEQIFQEIKAEINGER